MPHIEIGSETNEDQCTQVVESFFGFIAFVSMLPGMILISIIILFEEKNMAELRFPNINSVEISGRCTREPEFKYLQNGTAILKVDIAFNRNFKKNDEWQQEVGYIAITTWGDQAENYAKHLKKGSPVLVEAYMKMESWVTNENQKRSKIVLVAKKIHNLEKDSSENQDQSQEQDDQI